VQAPLEIREEDGDSFDPLLVFELFQPLLANFFDRQPAKAIFLCLQIEFFQLLVRESQKIAQISGHESPLRRIQDACLINSLAQARRAVG
jgi:hypothetical protein